MKISIIIPHYKAWKITAHCIYKIIENSIGKDIEIIIGDNCSTDGSSDNFKIFEKYITLVKYPIDQIQSHGILIDYVLKHGYVNGDYFIAAESDSFPTNPDWLDYYEVLAKEGYDAAGSVMQLSGGTYLHPCGAMYKKSIWHECKKFCDEMPYLYFPNMAMKDGFASHLMVHERCVNAFLNDPSSFVELSDSYKPYFRQTAIDKLNYYHPTCGPFHDGRGGLQESVKTYGNRGMQMDGFHIEPHPTNNFIYRVGYEPGQFLTYWMLKNNKKIYNIPIETKWLPNRENQNQEYTKNAAGFIHIWGVSAYHKADIKGHEDVIEFKANQVKELWDSLPEEYKTPIQ